MLARRCSLSAETGSYFKIKKIGVGFRMGKNKFILYILYKLVIIRFLQPVGPAMNIVW